MLLSLIMREHTACTCRDSATKAQAHPAPGISVVLTSRNCRRYFATAPLGKHPLGSVCSGLLPGKTDLRVCITPGGSCPAAGGRGHARRLFPFCKIKAPCMCNVYAK